MRKTATALAIFIAVFAAIFVVPVVPTTFPAIFVLHPIHYYRSISTLFSPFGTSLYGGNFYFRPQPPPFTYP